MKPCPNPVCKTPEPRIESKNLVTFYVVCRHCGMRGPKSSEEYNAIRLWDILPRNTAATSAQSVQCGNCGVYRTVENGIIQDCENCGDDETDLALLSLKMDAL